MNVVFFLLGESPASGSYVPTFRNSLFHLHECSATSALKILTLGTLLLLLLLLLLLFLPIALRPFQFGLGFPYN